jgi:hypothetical protein
MGAAVVLGLCNGLEMKRVDAVRIPTAMVNVKITESIRAEEPCERDTMSLLWFSAESELAIAVLSVADPFPAFRVRLPNLREEAKLLGSPRVKKRRELLKLVVTEEVEDALVVGHAATSSSGLRPLRRAATTRT